MKTGDILLCSGNGLASQLIIKYNKIIMNMTGPAAEISHVAMIGPSCDSVFEATTQNWNGKKGVQTNMFKDWINHYNGRVWIRRQRPDAFTQHETLTMITKMTKLIGTPYESGIPGARELMFAGMNIPFLSKWLAARIRTKTSLHCSEADALVLQSIGRLSSFLANKLPPCLWWDNINSLDLDYEKPEQLK